MTSVYDKTLVQLLSGLERSARSLAANADGSLLAAGDGAGNVAVFSVATGAKARAASGHAHTPRRPLAPATRKAFCLV